MKTKIKSLLFSVALFFGAVMIKPCAVSALDYQSSTFTYLFVGWVATATAQGGAPSTYTIGGLQPTGVFDVERIYLSTGYNGTAFFMCVDSIPVAAQTGVVFNPSSFVNEQYLFPPVTFIPSTATVTGLPQVIDFRAYLGGGRTIKNGLVCGIAGDTTNKYWYTIETDATPTRLSQRR